MNTNQSTTTTPSRHLDEPIRTLDLRHEVEEAWSQLATVHAGHTARTLYKQSMHRAVLLVMKRGAQIPEHRADGESSMYVLSGRVSVQVNGHRKDLSAGQFIGLAFGEPHDMEAHDDCAVLLTLSQVR